MDEVCLSLSNFKWHVYIVYYTHCTLPRLTSYSVKLKAAHVDGHSVEDGGEEVTVGVQIHKPGVGRVDEGLRMSAPPQVPRHLHGPGVVHVKVPVDDITGVSDCRVNTIVTNIYKQAQTSINITTTDIHYWLNLCFWKVNGKFIFFQMVVLSFVNQRLCQTFRYN